MYSVTSPNPDHQRYCVILKRVLDREYGEGTLYGLNQKRVYHRLLMESVLNWSEPTAEHVTSSLAFAWSEAAAGREVPEWEMPAEFFNRPRPLPPTKAPVLDL